MLENISIIGVGNLTQSLLYSIDNSSLKLNINLYDKDNKKKVFASQKRWKFFTKVGKEIASSDIIILAVKPNQYKNICSDDIAALNYISVEIPTLKEGMGP